MRRALQSIVFCLAVAGNLPAADTTKLVICAPGYPSNTEEAQPTMDELSRAVEISGGLSPASVTASYHPDVQGGLAALAAAEAGLALVPLPFYLEHRDQAALTPLLSVELVSGAEEVWSLVAKRDAVAGPDSLRGWEVAGLPAYSPRFVRGVALVDWGHLTEDTRIRFEGRVLSLLRRAARDEPVAVLLDRAQTAALDDLPYAADLEVVGRSKPMVGSLLCRVGNRLGDERVAALSHAFAELDKLMDAKELLETLQIKRFGELDTEALRTLERDFDDDRTALP
jgi:ABC-type phosphate/phosphonate transport system substrate-binding protein